MEALRNNWPNLSPELKTLFFGEISRNIKEFGPGINLFRD